MSLSFLYVARNKPSKSVTFGTGVLNDTAIQYGHKNAFQFFPISLTILEQFECRRGNPYMTADRNFVRLPHS